ncbi:hypothetical protein O7627_24370 [Solwaraspora sp. WMMD1047]|uniref:hypothetical protein n=1 Tax=Solwaraspora sp. WMMD1047 TaxID=3016102 RepID=UPI002415D496|nr:hypothetical protein [Solwaraspora sp. WMMD1047]MDG4832419.1 hypothetical protein [Solwaraspora sp. WMMD1047]
MSQPMPRPRSQPVRPSEDRVRRLTELGDWHREWTARHADDAGFRPTEHPTPGSDYNVHHVDLDAPAAALDEFHERARRIMGLPAE